MRNLGLFGVPLVLLVMVGIFSPVGTSAMESIVLSGKVMDIDGKPVAGAEIFVYDSAVIRRPADFISARTGEDGKYKLTLPHKKFWGVARVRSDEKFGPLLPGDRHSGEPIVLDPEESDALQQDFTVVDIQEAARQKQKIRSDITQVKGMMVDKSGKPVRDAYVFAITDKTSQGIPEYVSAWTNDSGNYTLFLPAGRYFLGGSAIFPPLPGTITSQELRVESGSKPVSVNITISPAHAP